MLLFRKKTAVPTLAGACLTLLVACLSEGAAAEIRLKAQTRCRSSIVLLGDVAEVFAADEFQAAQLMRLELGPAPGVGSRRFVRAREVQDALWSRGLNLADHRFTGVEQSEVVGPGEPVVEGKRAFHPTEAQRERAVRTADDLVLRHLRKAASPRDPYRVVCELNDEQVAVVAAYGGRMEVSGGAAPWTGRQTFVFATPAEEKAGTFEVVAEVSLPPGAVTVVKPLSAGSIIHETDVALLPSQALNPSVQPFHSLADVVGRETTWSIPAGTVLTPQSIRRPQLVRRGDAVTLYARHAGLSVRTTVRAREDGGQGDLITVESLTSREPFYARVTGVQEAEVFAAPAEASPRRVSAGETRFDPTTSGGGNR